MAVSKRTRFEVLRRDDHTCRYCGQCAPDVRLTVDHVVPVALGGTDLPDNLVTACADCNSGKASTSPSEHIVAEVSNDAVRWAAAMKQATERAAAERSDRQSLLKHFKEHVWNEWQYGPEKKNFPLPLDWEEGILRNLDNGLTMADLEHAVDVTMKKTWVSDEFRYFMGVCRTMLQQCMDEARKIIGGGDV